jgi:hypothetical protein
MVWYQPPFLTMSFIKDKTKIREELLKALSATVLILAQNIPGVLVHCIQKEAKLPLLSSATASIFPTMEMMVKNYMFIQNAWSLQPGTRNKPKLPAPKVGKNVRQLFDENWDYDGLDRIAAIMWITADVNVKVALNNLQMELKGKHLQIRWKAAQKKNTKNQIVIYGLPPGFDPKGIMRELLNGLKESEKELCDGQKFPLDQNMPAEMCHFLFLMAITGSPPPSRLRPTQKGWKTPLIKTRSLRRTDADYFTSNTTFLRILGWMHFGLTSLNLEGANSYWAATPRYLSCRLLGSNL